MSAIERTAIYLLTLHVTCYLLPYIARNLFIFVRTASSRHFE